MFLFALLLGIYSYIIFLLGISGFLYKNVVIIFTLIFFVLLIVLQYKKFSSLSWKISFKKHEQFVFLILLCIFAIQVFINLIGALGPELAFDALWYHLTLPKLYILSHSIYHIPGGLLYYSDMPKLGEMLYVGALSFGNEIAAKLLHFVFGILSCLALYLFARKFFSQVVSLLAIVIFYSSLVVAWESTTAYVDLIRTFFEILALWSFVNWIETEKKKWFYYSAVMIGLAITTKLLAFGSLLIFLLLIFGWFLLGFKEHKIQNVLFGVPIYLLISILIPLPWLIFAYFHTGNPFYPFFSGLYPIAAEPFTLSNFFVEIWNIFTKSSDPISPLFLILLPLIIFVFPKFKKELKLITIFSLLSVIVWYFTPRTGGGRFILPYLPAYSIVCAAVFAELQKNKKQFGLLLPQYILIVILFTIIISIGYRTLAVKKYLPVLLGQQTKDEFLTNNLNFSYGDFYDTDGFFKKTIKPTDKVLLYGFHNLYYADFPFIDSSWVKKGDKFNYIAVQNGKIPERFSNWQIIYKNDKTMVKLYKEKNSQTVSY